MRFLTAFRAIRRSAATIALAFLLVVAPMVQSAFAQERPAPVAEFIAGWVGFADDGIVSEGMVGGAARFYLLPRIAVGPEVLFIQGENHSHLVLTGNLTWDLIAPAGGRPPRVTPFLVAGGGLYQTREDFPTGPYTSSEGAFTAGGGVRAAAGDRITVGVDVRIGWELHVRVNGLVGVRLGK
jgi:Outer membrane protein beta-barrel domain